MKHSIQLLKNKIANLKFDLTIIQEEQDLQITQILIDECELELETLTNLPPQYTRVGV